MNRMTHRMLGIGAAAVLAMLSVQVTTAGTVDVAQTRPNALIATAGELYWTSGVKGLFVHEASYAEVWRASKHNTPGEEQRLYREDRSTMMSFDSLVYAEVAGQAYIYFAANYDAWFTYIKRVPITGGPATVISRVPYIDDRSLKTDGSYLYWADKEAIRRMPIAGGAITILARTGTATKIALDTNYVYFNAGGSLSPWPGPEIYRVPKAGGAKTLQAVAASNVTDLYVHEAGGTTTLYWSDSSGGVQSYTIGASGPLTYQLPGESITATSVAFDGTRVLWTTCKVPFFFPDLSSPRDNECDLIEYAAGVTRTLVDGAKHEYYNVNAANIVPDTTQVFWGRSGIVSYAPHPPTRGLMKYVYTLPPSVSIDPGLIWAIRQGGGGLSAPASAVVSHGDTPYTYWWSVDSGMFHVPNGPQSDPDVSVFAALAACDSADGTLFVTVVDDIGRSANASAAISFTALRAPGGVCD